MRYSNKLIKISLLANSNVLSKWTQILGPPLAIGPTSRDNEICLLQRQTFFLNQILYKDYSNKSIYYSRPLKQPTLKGSQHHLLDHHYLVAKTPPKRLRNANQLTLFLKEEAIRSKFHHIRKSVTSYSTYEIKRINPIAMIPENKNEIIDEGTRPTSRENQTSTENKTLLLGFGNSAGKSESLGKTIDNL